MANADRPSGLRPIGTISGAPWTGHVRRRPVDAQNATAIFVGDAIILEDDGNVAPYTSGGGNLIGACVFVEVEGNPGDQTSRSLAGGGTADLNLSNKYLAATTAGYIYVVEGPDVLFEIQEDDGGGTALALTNIGSNGDVVAGAGSAVTGRSAHELDASDVIAKDASAATAQLRVVGFVEREDNEIGAWAKWIVRINEHSHRETTGL